MYTSFVNSQSIWGALQEQENMYGMSKVMATIDGFVLVLCYKLGGLTKGITIVSEHSDLFIGQSVKE